MRRRGDAGMGTRGRGFRQELFIANSASPPNINAQSGRNYESRVSPERSRMLVNSQLTSLPERDGSRPTQRKETRDEDIGIGPR